MTHAFVAELGGEGGEALPIGRRGHEVQPAEAVGDLARLGRPECVVVAPQPLDDSFPLERGERLGECAGQRPGERRVRCGAHAAAQLTSRHRARRAIRLHLIYLAW